jgi:hypothetical protein
MNYLLRLGTIVALVVLAFAGLRCLRSDDLQKVGLDVWQWPHWQFALAAESEREQRLDERFADLNRRQAAKDRIYRELIAGRVPLAQATARIVDLTAEPKYFQKDAILHYEGATDEQRLARAVIDLACELLTNEPSRAREVRRHLLDEVRRM